MTKKTRDVVDPTDSKRGGFGGFFETLMRRFKTALHLAMIVPFYAVGCAILGLATVPGVWLVMWTHSEVDRWVTWWGKLLAIWLLGTSVIGAIFLTGVFMIVVLPLANKVLLLGRPLKPWRGPYYSLEAIRWYIHNGITYIMRYTLLELFTPTPLALWFYRFMGMKIGRGAVINTTAISDPCLISIGAKVTIGGSATIVGHYGQAGFLVLSPVEIGDGATIGLKASIMGGVRIGANARVMPHSVVLPKTVIPDGEVWGGVPAQKVS